MKHVDYKAIVWMRLHLTDEADLDQIKHLLENTQDPDTIIDPELGFDWFEVILETEEFVPVEDNDGQSTIELYQDGNLIYTNKTNDG
jgi:hypothetical protein